MIKWDKPKKVRSTKEHNETYMSDSGVAGTYVPNMSEDDKQAWKGKHINKGKDNARVEVRKTFSSRDNYAQMLMVITKGEGVTISANGKMDMTFEELKEFNEVINEAVETIND